MPRQRWHASTLAAAMGKVRLLRYKERTIGAHVGGQCYLGDTNLQAVENKCYSKCLRSYHERATQDACQVGCSTAISVATRR